MPNARDHRPYAGGRKPAGIRSGASAGWASRSGFVPSFGELGEVVGQLDPREFTARACVIRRWQLFGVIKTARRNVELIRSVVVFERQLSAAVRTEAPRSLCG